MNRTVLALSLVACVAAGSAFADPTTTTPAAAAPTQTVTAPAPKKHLSDADTVVCKRETVTGTRIGGQEVCMTAAQWDQIRDEDMDALRRAPETQPMGGSGMGGMGAMGH